MLFTDGHLQALEAVVLRCPGEITSFLGPIIQVGNQYIKYDPVRIQYIYFTHKNLLLEKNYAGDDDDEDEEMADDDEDDEDLDDE